MDKLNSYFTIIFIIFAIILFVLLILNYLKQQKILKSIVVNKFALSSMVESSVKTNKKSFVIIAKNKSMTDATISSIGITIGLNHFDFLNTYKKQNNINSENIVINPRSFIKLSLSIKSIELLVKDNFLNKKSDEEGYVKSKLQKMGIYVTDCAGNTVTANASSFYKVIKADKKAETLGEEKLSDFIMNDIEYDGKEYIKDSVEKVPLEDKKEDKTAEKVPEKIEEVKNEEKVSEKTVSDLKGTLVDNEIATTTEEDINK